jgi:phosphodiesterase/alkaline phosphatase D-like protein
MTNRRFFLRASALSLAGATTALTTPLRAAPASPKRTPLAGRGYELTNGATALKRDDGTWIFWVRIVNFNDPKSDIHATLQIATDRGFSQIIDRISLTLSGKNSFIAQPSYTPKVANSQLYYRYVIDGNASSAPGVSSVVNSIAPWNTQSKAE